MLEIFYLENGKVLRANSKELAKVKDNPVWADAINMTKDEQALLQETFQLHPLTSEDLFSTGTRVKLEQFQNYLFFVFYGIDAAENFKMYETDFILGRNFLITSHKRHAGAHDQLKLDIEKLATLFEKGTDSVMHKLLDLEVDNYSPAIEQMSDKIEDLEAAITKQPDPELLAKVLEYKRRLARIKKFTIPQREKIGLLTKNEYQFISSGNIPYFRDIHDHAIRINDSIEGQREALGNSFDLYMSSVSNNTNEVMKVLSVIATIALPLTVVSGIYGTNFVTLPGASSSFGFWSMILFMVMLSTAMIGYFKWRNWF